MTAMAIACRTISSLAADPDVLVYRITGAFFFGAASTVGAVLDSIADSARRSWSISRRCRFWIPPPPMR